MSAGKLAPPLEWGQRLVNPAAQAGMDARAQQERAQVDEGVELELAHSQALRDYEQIDQLIRGGWRFLQLTGHALRGEAVDLGSGTGIGAAILAQFEAISRVYALDFSRQFVEQIMPVVFERYRAPQEKVQRVVGDFNVLEVPDASLALVLDLDALHHSEDLDLTLRECNRALQMGGAILAVDRAWPDHYTRAELDAKLDAELNDNLKHKYEIPSGQSFTRRDFGEHEYTLADWFGHFERNGFEPTVLRSWHPPALNRILLSLPSFQVSIWLSALLYRLGRRRLWSYGFASTRVLFVCIKTRNLGAAA